MMDFINCFSGNNLSPGPGGVPGRQTFGDVGPWPGRPDDPGLDRIAFLDQELPGLKFMAPIAGIPLAGGFTREQLFKHLFNSGLQAMGKKKVSIQEVDKLIEPAMKAISRMPEDSYKKVNLEPGGFWYYKPKSATIGTGMEEVLQRRRVLPNNAGYSLSHELGHHFVRQLTAEELKNMVSPSLRNQTMENMFENLRNKTYPLLAPETRIAHGKTPRALYWTHGGHYPYEELVADSIAQRAMENPNWEKLPINWNLFERFFK